VAEFAKCLGELWPEKRVVLDELPEYQPMVNRGLGTFLR